MTNTAMHEYLNSSLFLKMVSDYCFQWGTFILFFKHKTQLKTKLMVLEAMKLVMIHFLWTFYIVQLDPLISNKGKSSDHSSSCSGNNSWSFSSLSHLGSPIFKNNSTFVIAPFSVAIVWPQFFIKLTGTQ